MAYSIGASGIHLEFLRLPFTDMIPVAYSYVMHWYWGSAEEERSEWMEEDPRKQNNSEKEKEGKEEGSFMPFPLLAIKS